MYFDHWAQIFALTLIAGLAMALGASIASWDSNRSFPLSDDFTHGITAFGGGALLSAVALVLVPSSVSKLPLWSTILSFGCGTMTFALLDVYLHRSGTPTSNLLAMLSDFIPETLALGATFTKGSREAFVLAFLISMQNIPEGYNAFRELRTAGIPRVKIIWWLIAASSLGPLAGLLGYFYLSDSMLLVANTMLFASGGIIYIVFQDIAPSSKLKQKWLPALGASLGFLLGVIGHVLSKK